MKVIIAGSRDITDVQVVAEATREAHKAGIRITQVVSGGAHGVDRIGEYLAQQTLHCRVARFIPDWNRYGKSAGYRRNAEMSRYADALVAVWDGSSHGTRHMIETMRSLGKLVYVKEVH